MRKETALIWQGCLLLTEYSIIIISTESLMNNSKQIGMTLVELMVTLVIIAIVSTIAAPSVRDMLVNNRLTAANNQIVSAINYTRGEAVKRAYEVTMCARNSDGSACSSDANASYQAGWIVFVDCDGDGAVTTTNVCDYKNSVGASIPDGTADSPEEVLLDTVPEASNITVTASNTVMPVVGYKPNGTPAGLGGTITLNYNGEARYKITVAAMTGRISSCKVGTSGC